jgi:hypothetical protein
MIKVCKRRDHNRCRSSPRWPSFACIIEVEPCIVHMEAGIKSCTLFWNASPYIFANTEGASPEVVVFSPVSLFRELLAPEISAGCVIAYLWTSAGPIGLWSSAWMSGHPLMLLCCQNRKPPQGVISIVVVEFPDQILSFPRFIAFVSPVGIVYSVIALTKLSHLRLRTIIAVP